MDRPCEDEEERRPDWFRDLFDNPPISPLVLDLDGDGVDLIQIAESGAFFDLDVDGFAEKTAWIGPDDAFLAWDRNGNGIIDDRSELFGGAAADGFTMLALEDANADGVIDALDPVYAQLVLWRDLDGDGVTDAGELQSLADAGVASIDLGATYIDTWVGGNWFSHESTFARADGTSGSVIDVWFEHDQMLTRYLGAPAALSPLVALLPDLAGYGTVSDLSARLEADATMATRVRDLVLSAPTLSPTVMKAEVEALLLDWTGASAVAPGSRGTQVDARHLAFLEALHGRTWVGRGGEANPGNNAGNQLESYYDLVVQAMVARFMAQVPISYAMLRLDQGDAPGFDLPFASATYLDYDVRSDTLAADFSELASSVAGALTGATGGLPLAPDDIRPMLAEALGILGPEQSLARDTLEQDLVSAASAAGIGAAMGLMLPDILAGRLSWGASAAETISGTSAGEVLIGDAGDDTISGGKGSDTYLWARGHGDDVVIEDSHQGSADRLVLQGVLPAAVTLVRSGITVTLVVAESAPGAGDGGSVRLTDSLDDYYDRGVEQVLFEDGTVWTRADLRVMLLAQAATAGDDAIAGFRTSDTIVGGAGDDSLYGLQGSDTYLWARGDGDDTIREDTSHGGADRLQFSGVLASDVRLVRDGADILVLVSGSAGGAGDGGSIRLRDSVDDYYFRGVEQIVFADGAVWDRARMRQELKQGTDEDDVLYGTNADDLMFGGGGDDVLHGSTGFDSFDGGTGFDTIDFSYSSASWTFDLAAGTAITGATVESLVSVEAVIGGSGDDTIRGDENANVLIGGGGDDLMFGGGGDDVLHGSLGADGFDGGAGVDTLDFGYSSANWIFDLIAATASTGTTTETLADMENVSGGSGADELWGDAAGNVLLGRAGDDILQGRDGDDQLDGGTGDDLLFGGAGADTLVFRQGDGQDQAWAFDPTQDRIALDGLSPEQVSFTAFTTAAQIALSDGSYLYFHGLTGVGKSDLTFVDHATGAVLPVGYTPIDGTAGDDTLIGSASNEIVIGREGADFLWGVDGSNILDGGAGDDFHRSGAGEDTFVFRLGDGADVVELFDVAVDKIALEGVAEEDLYFWDDGSGTEIYTSDGTSLWMIGVTGVTPEQFTFV